jgi:hypothetical protein
MIDLRAAHRATQSGSFAWMTEVASGSDCYRSVGWRKLPNAASRLWTAKVVSLMVV